MSRPSFRPPHAPVLLGLAVLALPAAARPDDPPARALSRELCAAPRLAGTSGSLRAARFVARVLADAGWEVEVDEREVLLSLPRRLFVAGYADPTFAGALFTERATFDPDARPAGDVPRFNAWSASGHVRGRVVDVGRGLRADYERLTAAGVDVRGAIGLARYGGSYRGVKAQLAEAAGCAGLLLFNDPAEDGPERGAVWPRGKWKPGWAAQRGSISPLAEVPGDPSTPGWASPAPGTPDARRLDPEQRDASLPGIPVLPIGSAHAGRLLDALQRGGAWAELDLEVPRDLRTIRNVIARLPGTGPELVLAGNHRDAWVRGAQDAGSGTVSLLRAAQRLGARVADGWRPPSTIVLGFWDAEESGLIGSTEWGEAHATELRAHGVAYVNADALVSGLRLRVSGAPGLDATLRAALARVPDPASANGTLLTQWQPEGPLGLPGSGSDYTVFLHHLGLPILDLGFGGNGGGQYHTAFDDFPVMDRFLDPDWRGHETAGNLLAELLFELAERGRTAFDPAEAAEALMHHARAAEQEADDAGRRWLGDGGPRVSAAFSALRDAILLSELELGTGPRFWQALEAPTGLTGRPWYRNQLWAPGLETGYAAETFPELRRAAERGAEPLAAAVDDLVATLDQLAALYATPRDAAE
jgi:N-acetylated-alpha-linked acidic dipeptidase